MFISAIICNSLAILCAFLLMVSFTKGQRKILVMADNGEEREYLIPRGVHINVQEGEHVVAGEPLMDGPRDPHDILAVSGDHSGGRTEGPSVVGSPKPPGYSMGVSSP